MDKLLRIVRKSSNPSCTIGEMSSSDGTLSLYTEEAKIPSDRQSYVSLCLPPGEYTCHVEKCTITYKKMPVSGYWVVLDRVPWFPKACLFTNESVMARMGCIKLGAIINDEYSITDCEEACRQLIRWSKKTYEEIGNEDFILEIVQVEDDIHFSNLNHFQYLKMQEDLKEQLIIQNLEKEIYG